MFREVVWANGIDSFDGAKSRQFRNCLSTEPGMSQRQWRALFFDLFVPCVSNVLTHPRPTRMCRQDKVIALTWSVTTPSLSTVSHPPSFLFFCIIGR